MTETKTLTALSLKDSAEYDEHWLQEQLARDPSALGLGSGLIIRDRERALPYGGRLDMVLEDPDQDPPVRYEVELQLGRTDPSHILRTLEYWDLERRRFPQYQHVAVLLAEDVESRWANMLHLLNGECRLPLVVLKLEAFDLGGVMGLHCTKVLDWVSPEPDDADDADDAPVDRSTYEKWAGAETMDAIDRLFDAVRQDVPGISQNYVKHYVGVQCRNRSSNFMSFHPKKGWFVMKLKHSFSDKEREDAERLELDYVEKYHKTWFRVRNDLTAEQTDFLRATAKAAYEEYFQ